MTRYGPIGKCIYCGRHSVKLTEEHILPLGLGGVDTLRDASCEDCSRITGAYVEQLVLRRILIFPRTHWNMKSRRPKDRPRELPIGVGTPQKDFEWKNVAVAEHPSALMLPVFAEPGVFTGAAPTDKFSINGMWSFVDSKAEERLKKHGGVAGVYQAFSPDIFCRMIAKIAHCHAVAKVGVDGFDPLLPGLILGRTTIISHYVGCLTDPPAGSPPAEFDKITHELELGYQFPIQSNKPPRIIVRVRLFANLNTPTYAAVVGYLRG